MRLNKSIQKFLLWSLGALYFVISISLFYYLPKTQKINLVGTEVKRMDKKAKDSKTRDVRFVVASDYETNETLMFRNEDMPWPPYFKFDSGDLSGKVMNLEENKNGTPILATYYGWRIPLFSLYPNITGVKIVKKDYQHTSWFNIIFLSLIGIFAIFVFIFVYRKTKSIN